VGIGPAFTIRDRENCAALTSFMRHKLAFPPRQTFSAQRHVPRDLFGSAQLATGSGDFH
jgi:hypothetical protein